MRLWIYFIWVILIITIIFVIHVPIIHRYSPQLFVIEKDIARITETNSKYDRRIPRTIHQTWKNSDIPRRWNLSVESVRKLNAAQFQYRLWTDVDIHKFVREKEPYLYYNTFLSYSYDIQRVDAFRYVLLYHLGGIYIDMDAGCSRSLDILVNVLEALDPHSAHLAALPSTKPSGVSNDFMISTKGHPFFGQLIAYLSLFNHNYIVYYLTVMISAGSLYVTFNERLFDTSSEISPVRIIEGKVYTPEFLWFAGGNTWHGRDGLMITTIYKFIRNLDPFVLTMSFLPLSAVVIWICIIIRRRRLLRRPKRISTSI